MDPIVRGELESLADWDTAQPIAIDPYKLLVWFVAIATPWLAIAGISALALRAVG